MQPSDPSPINDLTATILEQQTTPFSLPASHPLPIRAFLTSDQPRTRLAQQGDTFVIVDARYAHAGFALALVYG